MTFTDDVLQAIVESARPLHVRLPDGTAIDENARRGDESAAVELNGRMQSWCDTTANGHVDRFRRRLAWDGYAIDQVADVVNGDAGTGGASSTSAESMPGWASTLKEAVDRADRSVLQDSLLRQIDNVQFAEVLLPFVAVARERIREQSTSLDVLQPSARNAIDRTLLGVLADLAQKALTVEFRTFCASQSLSPSPEVYRTFVLHVLDEGLVDILSTYSVLARLLSIRVDQCVQSTVEFLRRLHTDRDQLRDRFADGAALGRVENLSLGLSDSHNDGRSVFVVTFEEGPRVVYKPKDLAGEAAFNRLLGWLNDHGLQPELRVLTVWPREEYGWVEFVESGDCGSEAAAERCFRRYGVLLALFYAIDATDLHFENVIASGEHPVVIDGETLLHPHIDLSVVRGVSNTAQSNASDQLHDSVLRTGFIPRWLSLRGSEVADVTALGIGIPKTSSNADDAGLQLPDHAPDHAPTLDGDVLSAADYLEAILDGFQRGYQFLLEHRDRLLAGDGPLDAFEDVPIRFIFRNTHVYGRLLYQTRNPKYLRDGRDRSIALDGIVKAFLSEEDRPVLWSIVREERARLERMDVPLFEVRSGSRAITVDGAVIHDVFERSGYRALLRRMERLSPTDLQRQRNFIKASIHIRSEGTSDQMAETAVPDASVVDPISESRVLDAAERIAESLHAHAIRTESGTASWIGQMLMPESGRYQLQAMSLTLYDGVLGPGLFLAGLHRLRPRSETRALGCAAMRAVREFLDAATFDPEKARRTGIGGTFGWASVVYALVRGSEWLDAPDVLDDAREVASLITPEWIAEDDTYDVCDGAAGTILGLLALHDATGDASVLDTATACGEHLLANRVESASGRRAWITIEDRPTAGFAHGAAGIAYALLRLHAATGDARYKEAAAEAHAFEDDVYRPALKNWPDFLPDDDASAPTHASGREALLRWCHGAPGIGLGRVGARDILDDGAVKRDVKRDVERAIEVTREAGVNPHIDHPCCGTLGRAEFLLEAGRRLDRPDLVDTARRWAAIVVDRAEASGSYRATAYGDEYTLGFFQGKAGIGYSLLRMAHPDELPCVLLLE